MHPPELPDAFDYQRVRTRSVLLARLGLHLRSDALGTNLSLEACQSAPEGHQNNDNCDGADECNPNLIAHWQASPTVSYGEILSRAGGGHRVNFTRTERKLSKFSAL